jgi:hypothetical protein
MSETTTAAPEAPTAATAAATAKTETSEEFPADLGEAGKQAIERMKAERNDAKKQASDLQKQIDAINQANESAVEKAQREAQEAVQNAAAATVTAFREAAVKFGGITAEDAELFLTGTDAETLTKQAARLVERTSTGTTPGPRPDLTQGAKGTPATGDPAQDFANFLSGQMRS